jgi:hypothetical protein
MNHVTIAGGGAEAWQLMLDRTAAGPDYSLTVKPTPESGVALANGQLMNLGFRRYLALRSFLIGSANQSAVIDVLLYPAEKQKGVRACRLTLVGGADTQTGHPANLTGADTWRECDQAKFVSGLIAPYVVSEPDGQAIAYIDCAEFIFAAVRMESISGATRAVVLGRPCDSVPPPMEVPFTGTLAKAAAAASNEVLDDTGGTNLTVPGSGWQYVVKDLIVQTDTQITVQLGSNAGGNIHLPGTIFPVGLTTLPINPDGIEIAENMAPELNCGAFTGRVTILGVKRPVVR